MNRKRRRIRTDRILILVLVTGVILALITILVSRMTSHTNITKNADQSEQTETESDRTVKVTATGDILLEEPLLETFGDGDWQSCLDDIDPLLSEDDLTIANMEVPIGGEELGITGIDYSFNSPAVTADNLKEHSIEFVSLANNHAMDRGYEGLVKTRENLDRAGVDHTGTFESEEERNETKIVTVKDMKIAIVSWTYGTNQPADESWMVNSYHSAQDAQTEVLLQDVRQAAEQADAIIVCMHWGTEFTYEASEDQTILSQEIADAGADVIIGNHPHTIQPAEWIESEDGHRTLCFLSLGNFMSSAYQVSRADETFQNMYEVGAIAQFSLVPSDSEVTVQDVKIIPVINHFEGEYENFHLMKLKDYTEELAASHSQRRFSGLFTKEWLTGQVHQVFDGSGIELDLS